jgi:hypothetical protein
MVNQKIVFAVIVLLHFFINDATAQHGAKYTNESDTLVEGVFVSRDQFLKQQPAFKPDQLYRTASVSHFTIRSWSYKDSLYVYKNERKQTIPRDSVWGFYNDGNLFLQLNGYFHKVTLLGSISLFNEIYPIIKAPFNPATTDETKEVTPRMVDLHSGKIYPYNIKSMVELLQSDETLLNNYNVLNKKLRRKMMYSYIERFNDRHPLF